MRTTETVIFSIECVHGCCHTLYTLRTKTETKTKQNKKSHTHAHIHHRTSMRVTCILHGWVVQNNGFYFEFNGNICTECEWILFCDRMSQLAEVNVRFLFKTLNVIPRYYAQMNYNVISHSEYTKHLVPFNPTFKLPLYLKCYFSPRIITNCQNQLWLWAVNITIGIFGVWK